MARRSTANYLGSVPRASGTGPKNLPKTAQAAVSQVRAGRASVRRPSLPSASPARASAGYGSPPGGGASGVPKATTPMAGRPRVINTAQNRSAGRIGKPKADFPTQI